MRKVSIHIKIMLVFLVPVLYFACAGTPNTVKEELSIDANDTTVSSGPSEPADTVSSVITEDKSTAAGSGDTLSKSKKEESSLSPAPLPESSARSDEISSTSEKDLLFVEEESSSRAAPSLSAGSGSIKPSESGLKAGYSDDNRQFTYFVNFLEQYKSVPHFSLDISERIIINLNDSNGKSVPNADVQIKSGDKIISIGVTLADGSFRFYPSLYSKDLQDFEIFVKDPATGKKTSTQFTRNGLRQINLTINTERKLVNRIPMDILFILDTTGSMGEEIQRLKATIQLIHLNLSSLSAKPDLRFGMVLYKDDGDEEYRTKIVPLTDNLEAFQRELNKVEAYGGGDTPEDLQEALSDSLNKIKWNTRGIRLSFIITDAPPHLDYGQSYNYVQAARDAKEKGIKIHSVGTGGLPLDGEYILRQISQFTSGRYIFLTYGEEGESSGGAPGSVSHHTGANFQTDKLEAIIIRFAKEELSNLSDKAIEEASPFFEANKIESEKKEETLDTLFNMAIEQLRDYSSYSVGSETKAAVIPFEFNPEGLSLDAEYFSERLILSAGSSDIFKLVERKDIQKILEEQNLQLSGITEGETAVKLGHILNADVLITGNLFKKENSFELFLRLVRVETGEVLSVTRSVIDGNLGIK